MRFSGAVGYALVCTVLLVVGAPALGQTDLGSRIRAGIEGKAVAAPSESKAAVGSASQADLEAELAQTRERLTVLDAATNGGAASSPQQDQLRSLLRRLAVLLGSELGRMGANEAERRLATPALAVPEGPGPYRTADVDAMRNQVDAVGAQRRALELALKGLDTQIAGLEQARQKSEAELRLRHEQLERAVSEGGAASAARGQFEVAQLQARIAALELVRADADRQAGRDRVQELTGWIDHARAEIDRVRDRQYIDDQALAEVARAAEAARRHLAAQRSNIEARIQRVEPLEGEGDALPTVRETTSLRSSIAILDELEQIEAGREDVWRLRRSALEARADSERRAVAVGLVARSIQQLESRARAAAERMEYLRAGLAAEHGGTEGVTPGIALSASERRAQQAILLELGLLERLQQNLAELLRQFNRSQEDLRARVAPASAGERLGELRLALERAIAAMWNYELFSVNETVQVDGRAITLEYGVTIGKSVGVLLLIWLGYALARWSCRRLIDSLVRRNVLAEPLAKVLYRWLMSCLMLVVLAIVLKMAKIPLTAFAFMGGALAIGVGFGTQNIIKNIISGVIILLERKVRVGDIITIGTTSGTVSAIDFRATTLRGFDGIESILPNSTLLEQQVSNWSYGLPNVRREVKVGLSYGQDARAAADLMRRCAQDCEGVLQVPPPAVLFHEFGSDAQVLRLLFWVRLGALHDGPTVESELRFAITGAFQSAGLVIAFPQRDVHLRLVDAAEAPWTHGSGGKGVTTPGAHAGLEPLGASR